MALVVLAYEGDFHARSSGLRGLELGLIPPVFPVPCKQQGT